MKKILLSVIALFAAVCMNAQTEVLAGEGFFNLDKSSGWGGHWYSFANEGTEGNFDASAYDYVWIKYSGNTGTFRFAITYNEFKDWQAWGATYYDEQKLISDPEGIAYIPLEKTKIYEYDVIWDTTEKTVSPYAGETWDKHIQNVYTQDDGAEVSVVVEGVYFGTKAQLEAILNGETIDVWTIFGDKKLLGSDWDENKTNNNMKALDDSNFCLVKNYVNLEKGTYEYKVANNHSMDEVYPESSAILTITEDGIYNITFTFNVETKELNATAEICDISISDYIDCDVKWNGAQSSSMGPWGSNYAAGVDAVFSNFYSEAIKIVGMKVYEGDTMIGELTDYLGTTIDANSSFTVSFSVTSTIQMPTVLPWIELTYSCNGDMYTKNSTERATVTSISNVKTKRNNNDTIYSLDGRKLKTIPSHGLYILNGKKYIAK